MKYTVLKMAGAALLISALISTPGCNRSIPEPSTPPDANVAPQTSEHITPETPERPASTANVTVKTTEQAPKPDLIIESVSYVPVYTAGLDFAELETLYFTVTVKNIGDAAAWGAFYVSNTRDDYDYYTFGERVNGSPSIIATGQTLKVHMTKNIPAHLSSTDIWTIRFIVNHRQDFRDISALRRGIVESDYYNNTFDLSMLVGDLRDPRGMVAQASKPDLIIDSVSYEFTGGSIVFHLSVKNIGTAPISGPFYALNGRDYLSKYVSRSRVNHLGSMIAPGETLVVPSAKAFPPTGIVSDDWSVELIVNHLYDPTDNSVLLPGIKESNYENNTYELRLSVSDLVEELRVLNEPRPYLPWGPQILNPQGGSTTSLLPTFAWAPVAGATKYEFILAEDPALTQIVLVAYPTLTTVSIANYLKPDTTYFWAVRTIQPTESGQTISTFNTQAAP